jgi:serine/threonine protein phosphatase PrpC
VFVSRRWWRPKRRQATELTSDVVTPRDPVDAAEGSSPDLSETETQADGASELTSAWPAATVQPVQLEWAPRQPNEGEPEIVTIGAASTFGSADWWDTDWWPLEASDGDIVADFATIGDFAVAGTTLRGNKHRLGGDPGEDSFHLRRATSPSGEAAVCIAVCDGVGSASRSRHGARWLARAATARLAIAVATCDRSTPLSEPSTREAIAAAVVDVRELAERRNIDLAALQTTLAFAVVMNSDKPGARAVVGQIGDSPVFIGTNDGLVPAISSNEVDGPILSTATHDAISAAPEALRVSVVHLSPGDRLLACSDGIGNFLWSPSGTLDLGHHLAATLRAPVPQLEFVRQVSFDLRSADDDRTLVVLWTRPITVEPGT